MKLPIVKADKRVAEHSSEELFLKEKKHQRLEIEEREPYRKTH